jgi:hypothetical protein
MISGEVEVFQGIDSNPQLMKASQVMSADGSNFNHHCEPLSI